MNSNPYESPVGAAAYERPVDGTMTLKSIDPLQAGKVLAVMYLVLGLIYVPLFLLISIMSEDAAGAAIGIGMAVGVLVGCAVGGFLGGLLMALIYNVIAKLSGGLRFRLE